MPNAAAWRSFRSSIDASAAWGRQWPHHAPTPRRLGHQMAAAARDRSPARVHHFGGGSSSSQGGGSDSDVEHADEGQGRRILGGGGGSAPVAAFEVEKMEHDPKGVGAPQRGSGTVLGGWTLRAQPACLPAHPPAPTLRSRRRVVPRRVPHRHRGRGRGGPRPPLRPVLFGVGRGPGAAPLFLRGEVRGGGGCSPPPPPGGLPLLLVHATAAWMGAGVLWQMVTAAAEHAAAVG